MTIDGRWEAQFTVPSSCSIAVTNNGGGPTTVTLTPGTYVLSTLVTHLQTALTAQRAPSSGAWTVSLSTGASGTGKVTISISASTYSITWTSSSEGTNLRDLLGFTANVTTQSTSTGGSQARGLWIPDCPIAASIPSLRTAPRRTDRVSTRTPKGKVISHVGNSRYVHPGIVYQAVAERRVWKAAESVVNESLERFLEDVCWGAGHTWFDASGYVHVYDKTGTKVGSTAGIAGWYLTGRGTQELVPRPVSEQWGGLYTIDGFDLETDA